MLSPKLVSNSRIAPFVWMLQKPKLMTEEIEVDSEVVAVEVVIEATEAQMTAKEDTEVAGEKGMSPEVMIEGKEPSKEEVKKEKIEWPNARS